MPVVDVQLVQPPSGVLDAGLAQEVADAIGRDFNVEAGRVWVRLHVLSSDRYAENGCLLQDHELPVFVTVLLGDPPAQEARAAHALALASAVAAAVGRPVARVHVEYAPSGRGRVAFGGRLLG